MPKKTEPLVLGENFDSRQARLNRNIYGTSKGRLRLDLIGRDLQRHADPAGMGPITKVLDLGCGEARLSSPYIQAGCAVTLVDLSSAMLDTARQRLLAENIDLGNTSWVAEPLQDYLRKNNEKFDLILLHAVIEWVEEPHQVVSLALGKLAEDGLLSLAFYNRNSLLFRNLLQGNFRKLKKNVWIPDSRSLTPYNPIDPAALKGYLTGLSVETIAETGVRTFFDYLQPKIKTGRSYEDVLEMELRFSKHPAFMGLARYLHWVIKKRSV